MDEILKKKKYNVSLAASRLRSPEKPLLLLYSLWLEEETVPSSNRSSTHDTSFLAFSSAQTHPSSELLFIKDLTEAGLSPGPH